MLDSCKHDNETSALIKDGIFLEQLSYCQLLKDDFGL